MDYAFHVFNTMSDLGISTALNRFLEEKSTPPVIVCIGSDLSIGDSLGPIVGTMLQKELKMPSAYLYGTLKSPVTAKEVKYLESFLKKTHPGASVIAIDAAVGDESEIGLVKVSSGPLRPGSGANKRLGKIGDVSILGVLAKKTSFCYSQLNVMRLNIVYMMAETISKAICSYLEGKQTLGSERAS